MTNTKIIEMHSSSFEKRNVAKTIPNLFKISVLGLILAGHAVSCSPESRSVHEIGDPIITLGPKDSPRDVWVGAAMFEGLWGTQIPNEIDVEESAGSPESYSSNQSTSAGSSTDKPSSEINNRASTSNGASSSSSGPSRPTSPEFPFPIQSPRSFVASDQNAAPQTPHSAEIPLSPAPETPECTLPGELPPSLPFSPTVGLQTALEWIDDPLRPNSPLCMMSGEPVVIGIDGKETEMTWVEFVFWLADRKRSEVSSNFGNRDPESLPKVSVRFPDGTVMNVIDGKSVVLQLPEAAPADAIFDI